MLYILLSDIDLNEIEIQKERERERERKRFYYINTLTVDTWISCIL